MVTAAFDITVDALPIVTGPVTYATTGTTGVGVGATAQGIVIHGADFATGAKVGSFTNTAGVADTGVTVTVTAVNAAGTTITGTVAVAAGDANRAVGYTVTNADGGTDVISAYQFPIVIDAGPTITAVSPATATGGSTTAFTITGTGFATGAVVTASSNGTCGTTTVASATSITVSCTLGAASATSSTSLVVTNVDGGLATSAVVLPESVPVVVTPFFISGAHGYAVPGRTVTMTLSGSGFFGQPTITSSAGGRVGVSHDTGTLLTIRVFTPKTAAHGEHTFTVTLANGKTGKKNYAVK